MSLLREYEYVVAIAKYQNITKAAESLYVGQPTLSKFLKTLEDELGVALFRKSGHKYYPTYAGERYIAKAEQILRLQRDLDHEISDIIERHVGVLRVGFPTMRCTYMLPCTLPPFREIYPNIKVEITEGPSSELDQKLINSEIDLAFYNQHSSDDIPMIQSEVLGIEELLICVPKGHPVGRHAKPNPHSRYPKLDVRYLKNETVLMLHESQRTRRIMDHYLKKQNITFENVMYTNNIPAIMELIAVGYGVSFLSEPHIFYHSLEDSIDCDSCGETRMTSALVVAKRKNSYLPSYANDFIELTKRLYIEEQ